MPQIAGAVHRAAGKKLYEACLKIPEVSPGVRCPTGEARTTPGFELPAKFVIHTVGPVWSGGGYGEAEKLASCYRNCLALAFENEIQSIAFPAISCGVFGYPVELATKVAIETILQVSDSCKLEIELIAFSESVAEVMQRCIPGSIDTGWDMSGRVRKP